MTLTERKKRLQSFLGFAGKQVDGILGPATIDRLEKQLGIVEAFGTKLPPVQVPAPPAARPADRLDPRSEKNLATLIPQAAAELRQLILIGKRLGNGIDGQLGLDVRAISGTRTWAEQDALHAQGRTKPGPIVTNARGGYSNHNFGIAIDLGVFDRAGRYMDGGTPTQQLLAYNLYRDLAAAAARSRLNVEWGGDWKSFPDPPHFEFETGLSLAQMRARTRAGQPLV